MLGNDRLYSAVKALATAEGDVKARVCLAMSMLVSLNKNELDKIPGLLERVENLERVMASKGPLVINGCVVKDPYVHTSTGRRNKTYKKYAEEIMSIWLATFER